MKRIEQRKNETCQEKLLQEMPRLISLNFREFVENLAMLSGSRLQKVDRLVWYNRGLPHAMYNYAYTDQPVQASGLASLMDYYRVLKTPFYFCTGLKNSTEASKTLLGKAGLTFFGYMGGMCFDLHQDLPKLAMPKSCEIRVVNNTVDYLEFAKVMAKAALINSGIGVEFFKDYHRLKECKFVALLAYLEGYLVGCSMIMRSSPLIAGNYFDWVLGEHRKKGINTAMTLKRMQLAQSWGHRFLVAQCMSTSKCLYERLGFKNVCEMGLYGKEFW